MGRVGKKHHRAMVLPTRSVDTGARYTLPVFTGRVHGPCGPAPVNTGVQNDTRVGQQSSWP